MSVRVKISTAHQYATNGLEIVEVEGTTIWQCLKDLIRKFPPLEKLMYNDVTSISDYLLIFLNGENVPHSDLNKMVKERDEIALVMLIDGG
jgi:hypothetical protein